MTTESKIQWTDHTYNPWQGCKHVSAGCDNCYMFRDKARWGEKGGTVKRSVKATFNKPLTWHAPAKVFTCSWSDFFIQQADEWRAEAWDIIRRTPHLTYQILTKRPERIMECLPPDWGDEGYPNVWIGVSAANQDEYEARAYYLDNIAAEVVFISFEPLIEHIAVNPALRLDWAIIGGESGNGTKPITEYAKGDKTKPKFGYRICEEEWIIELCQQLKYEGVPVFVKQTGTHHAKIWGLKDKQGGNYDDFLELYKYREFPNQ